MECIILAFKVVLPIMVYVTIGYILRLLKFFDEKSLKTVNNLVFKVFLPCLLFYNIYTTQIDKILDFDLIVYAVCFVSILFLLLMIFVPVFVKDNSKRGVIIQGIFRSNFVLFGMPVTISLMGEGNGGLTSIAIAFIVPLYNVLAVICLETFRKNKINIFTVLKGIVKNPLIISSVLGILFLSFEIKLPVVLSDIVRDLSRVATPLALVGLGASFTFRSVKNNLGYLSAIETDCFACYGNFHQCLCIWVQRCRNSNAYKCFCFTNSCFVFYHGSVYGRRFGLGCSDGCVYLRLFNNYRFCGSGSNKIFRFILRRNYYELVIGLGYGITVCYIDCR